MAHPAHATPGNVVGHYEVLSEIGTGGMGVVYKAFEHKLERTVALKFLPPDSIGKAADRHRLLHEARAASTLDHKNIATIHTVEESEDGPLFIVMAYWQQPLHNGQRGADTMLLVRRGSTEELCRRGRETADHASHGFDHPTPCDTITLQRPNHHSSDRRDRARWKGSVRGFSIGRPPAMAAFVA